MLRLLSLILILTLSTTVSATNFTDTEYSLYRDSIETLSSEGVISGYGDGRFGGENTITRAEILKVLFKSKGETPPSTETSCFTDVATTVWYHPYVCQGVQLGVVKGFDDGTFRPNAPVTVLEALAMSLRLYGVAPENGTPWYITYQKLADDMRLLDSASYSLMSPMTRGKATELVLKVREYSKTKTLLSYLSKGCTATRSLSSGTYEIQIAGKIRSYILFVPQTFSDKNPAKLILALHGRTNSNSMVQDYMGLERQKDFIVAYPAGLPNRKAFSWSENENITFMDALVQKLTDTSCIEKNQIFIVAHSMGAGFGSKIVCQRGDTFRGMSIVGGGGWNSGCNSTPTATLIYQRPDDQLSSPESARVTQRNMRTVNTCSAKTERIKIGSNTCQKWKDCSTGNPVIYCESYPTYGNDPHSWPTSGGNESIEFLRGL